jgi:probable aminopeptidase NPEPL1
MPAQLELCATLPDLGSPEAGSQRVLVGFPADLDAALPGLIPPAVCGDAALPMLKVLLDAAKPSSASGAFTTATLPLHEGFLVLHAVLLPRAATRYNARLRPDVLARHAAKALAPHHADVRVVDVLALLPASATPHDDALAITNAIARELPLYTRKRNACETPSGTTVRLAFRFGGRAFEEAESLAALTAVARGVRACAALVDAPCNEMDAAILAAKAKEAVAALPSVVVEEIVGEELAQRGFGGIYGVGKAAVVPPRLVILKHEPAGSAKTVVLAGKVELPADFASMGRWRGLPPTPATLLLRRHRLRGRGVACRASSMILAASPSRTRQACPVCRLPCRCLPFARPLPRVV